MPSSTAHWQDGMARQTVRRPAAQHTDRTEWPDKLSDALQHSTWAWQNGQTNCQTPCSTAHGPDVMARQTVRHPPAQHTGRMEWPDKLSDALWHSTWAWQNGQTNCQTPSCTAHEPDVMARQTVRRPAAQHTGRTEWPDK
eukprot:2216821-Rhodomonas_salina.1